MVTEMQPLKKRLAEELEATKLELMRTRARLHQVQETSVTEAVFFQLRGQYLQVHYELWIMKACVAWMQGACLRVTHCLEASLDCTTLETQAVVADWLKRLDQFSRSEAADSAMALELEGLLATAEWRDLMKRMVKVTSTIRQSSQDVG